MSESAVVVALFFDDSDLGSHLRTALAEHGAQIAHEGPLASFDEAQLRKASVNALVVNLDDAIDDDTLDRIYGLVDDGLPVIFNDAQASRALDGWDRARWARHLAAKVLKSGAIDPPRPESAREVEAPPASVAAEVPQQVEPAPLPPIEPLSQPQAAAPLALEPVEPKPAATIPEEPALTLAPIEDEPAQHENRTHDDSETLAAELEALLASDMPVGEAADDFGSGLKYDHDHDLPPLHDGDFGAFDEAPHIEAVPHSAPALAPAAATPAAAHHAATLTDDMDFDQIVLALLDNDEIKPPALEKSPLASSAPLTPSAPEWGFVDDDKPTPALEAADEKPFGVEKLSAADYLAPNVEASADTPSIEPGLSLELVAMEEAIAPQAMHVESVETHLHELDTAFARLLVLGATRESADSLNAFLAALPTDLRMPILLTQHIGNGTAEQLAQILDAHSAMPVRVAASGTRARLGEILLVPRGQQVRIRRDGQVEVSAAKEDTEHQSPSIDSSFTLAANVYGRDVLAIVFAGRANDAVAGAQAIHDRGGQVWVESSSSDHYADMVHGVLAERLASFSGSPHELAARLAEDFR